MKKTGQDILYISIITLITALGWVVFDAYHAYTISTTSKALEEIAIPLTPKLNVKVIENLKTRHEPVAVPVPLLTNVSTKSGTATSSSQTSSGSANLK